MQYKLPVAIFDCVNKRLCSDLNENFSESNCNFCNYLGMLLKVCLLIRTPLGLLVCNQFFQLLAMTLCCIFYAESEDIFSNLLWSQLKVRLLVRTSLTSLIRNPCFHSFVWKSCYAFLIWIQWFFFLYFLWPWWNVYHC